MHRHGYKGRKFGRERDQRNALTTGLILSLIEHRAITTTLMKAKEIRPKAEKIITIAKNAKSANSAKNLANRRLVISRLNNNIQLSHLLVDEIAPQISRNSGYLRIVKLNENRVGDNSEMARIEFVDKDAIEKYLENSREKSAKSENNSAKKSDEKSVKSDEKVAKKSDNSSAKGDK